MFKFSDGMAGSTSRDSLFSKKKKTPKKNNQDFINARINQI